MQEAKVLLVFQLIVSSRNMVWFLNDKVNLILSIFENAFSIIKKRKLII